MCGSLPRLSVSLQGNTSTCAVASPIDPFAAQTVARLILNPETRTLIHRRATGETPILPMNDADIDPFFLALGDPSAYAAQFPGRDIMNGDINADGSVNGADIDRFFECLGGGCP